MSKFDPKIKNIKVENNILSFELSGSESFGLDKSKFIKALFMISFSESVYLSSTLAACINSAAIKTLLFSFFLL